MEISEAIDADCLILLDEKKSQYDDSESGLYIAGCLLSVICPAFAPMFLMAVTLTAVTLAIGGTIAGIRSKRQGKGFWSGFDNYINHNWAQSLSISIAITMITFGISQAIQAASAAGSKSELANVVKNPELMSGLSDQQILAIQNAAKDLPKGNYSVYLSKTDVYVGITGRSAPIRAAEHLAKSQRIIEPFISGLSKESARIVEQSVIEIV